MWIVVLFELTATRTPMQLDTTTVDYALTSFEASVYFDQLVARSKRIAAVGKLPIHKYTYMIPAMIVILGVIALCIGGLVPICRATSWTWQPLAGTGIVIILFIAIASAISLIWAVYTDGCGWLYTAEYKEYRRSYD